MKRVGLAGCGRWGANVLRDLVDLGATVTVADPDPSRREHARVAGAVDAVSGADALPTCDGYVVVTPAGTHRAVLEPLLDRGAPVFVEKPPCTNVGDVAALVQRGGGRLFVMHKWRYHPGIRELAQVAASGLLGSIVALETTRIGPEPLPDGVDVVWHLGTHDLSIALEILGSVGPLDTASGHHDGDGRIDECTARMAQDHGVVHTMVLGAGGRERIRSVRVVGREGSAALEWPEAPSISVDGPDGVEAIALGPTMPLAAELAAFLEYLDGGPPPVSDGASALAVARRLSEIQRAVDGHAT